MSKSIELFKINDVMPNSRKTNSLFFLLFLAPLELGFQQNFTFFEFRIS